MKVINMSCGSGIRAAIIFLLLLFAGGCDSAIGNGDLLTRDKYERVPLGLSYHQVVQAFGSPGKPLPAQDDKKIRAFAWQVSKDGDTAIILFLNGKSIEKIPPNGW